MTFSLLWLPQVLKDSGLKVAPVDGWQDRGDGDVNKIVGIICHHTAGPRNGNMPSLQTLIQGRSDLPGPLAQLGLGRDGTYFVVEVDSRIVGCGGWSRRKTLFGSDHVAGKDDALLDPAVEPARIPVQGAMDGPHPLLPLSGRVDGGNRQTRHRR